MSAPPGLKPPKYFTPSPRYSQNPKENRMLHVVHFLDNFVRLSDWTRSEPLSLGQVHPEATREYGKAKDSMCLLALSRRHECFLVCCMKLLFDSLIYAVNMTLVT